MQPKKTAVVAKEGAIEKVCRDILILCGDLEKIDHKIPPGVAGFYGELLAWKHLRASFQRKGYSVGFGSGQSKADIVLSKGGKKINIEVKTSRLKEEKPGWLYGFAINIKRCTKHPKRFFRHPKKGVISGDFCYFDYLLVVTLSSNLRNPRLYVFPVEYLWANEISLRNTSRQFSSNSHRIMFVEKEADLEQEITNFDKHLTKHRGKYQNAWGLIK